MITDCVAIEATTVASMHRGGGGEQMGHMAEAERREMGDSEAMRWPTTGSDPREARLPPSPVILVQLQVREVRQVVEVEAIVIDRKIKTIQPTLVDSP